MKTLPDIKDLHAGKLAFILGAGPSLRHVDVEMLKCGVTFTVNSAILKLPTCDYWVSDDQDTHNWGYFKNVVVPSPAVKLVDRNRLGKFVKDLPGFVTYHRQNWYDWFDPKRVTYHVPNLSLTQDPSKPIAGTRTSVATAVHLAWIMGCSPIVLLGCDCRYEDGKRWFWEFGGYDQQARQGRDAFPNVVRRDPRGAAVSDTHCDEMLTFWKVFAMALRDKVPVYNASGGVLTAFKRRHLSEFACPPNRPQGGGSN